MLETDELTSKATFLDPRFKKEGFDSEVNAQKAYNWIADEVPSLIQSRESQDQTNESEKPSHQATAESKEPEGGNILWGFFDKKVSGVKKSAQPGNVLTDLLLKQYLELPHLPRKRDPLDFWKTCTVLPELQKLQEKYLGIPATSVPSERVFSKAGQITNQRRNRLSAKNLDQIIFLNVNINTVF